MNNCVSIIAVAITCSKTIAIKQSFKRPFTDFLPLGWDTPVTVREKILL